jgi:exosortase/archaeosortase family protein
MDVKSLLRGRKIKTIAIILASVAVIYIAIRLVFPESYTIRQLCSSLYEQYLYLSLRFSLLILKLFGYFSLFTSHVSDVGQSFWIFFAPAVRYKKLALAIVVFIWVTKASFRRKSVFTLIVLSVHFASVSLYNITGLSCNPYSDPDLVFSVPDTIACFALFTCLVAWFKLNSQSIYDHLLRIKYDIIGFKSKIVALTVILYCYIIINQFVFAYFSFSGWVKFLFVSVQKILALMGYDASVDSTYLIGENGTIYMAKFCLGIKTMYLFASVVYLTGRRNITRWLYILGGLVVINIINIFRFVLLFIHVQRNGDYTLSMDLHMLYNIILYSIVFLLWVFWFEKYSDIIPEKQHR